MTLLVDTKQAEALQIAIENGNISLSIRNPLDKEIFEFEGTVLSQDRLFDLGSALTPTVSPSVRRELDLQEEQGTTDKPQGQAQSEVIFDANMPAQQTKPVEQYQIRKSSRWGVTVIRGQQTKVEEFDTSENDSGGLAAKK